MDDAWTPGPMVGICGRFEAVGGGGYDRRVAVAAREQQAEGEPDAVQARARYGAPVSPLAVGNGAVGRLLQAPSEFRLARAVLPRGLGNRSVARMLQRYDAYEHAKQGDHAQGSLSIDLPLSSGSMSGLVRLTSGQINALADLFASPEDLWNADAVEVEKLKALTNRQLADPKSVQESEWDDATGGRYNRLNLKNSAHFGPRNKALIDPGSAVESGLDNRAYFIKYYMQTVVAAQTAYARPIGLPVAGEKEKWLDRAVITAGFAEHFLMDAFSAGHLFSKDDFITVLKGHLDALGNDARGDLLGSVAKTVLADASSKTLLGTYELTDKNIPWYIGGGWTGHPNLDSESVFKGLLQHLYDDNDGRQAVYSALVKVVHDALSQHRNADGSIGVEVENGFGTWILSGDKTLASSPKTQEMIDKAIEEFRRAIEPYRNGPVSDTDPTSEATKIIKAHFPRPTAATVKLISNIVTTTTDAGQGTINALVDVMKKELPSILSALKDRGEIRKA